MRKTGTIAAAALALSLVGMPAYAVTGEPGDIDDLTLLASTDIHGTLVDYDYFTGAPFGTEAKPQNARGMDRLSTAIKQVRQEKGEEAVILLDNGDAAQGSSIETVYHANRAEGTVDPMAAVFNYLNYDAVNSGNHEFNYGLEALKQHIDSLNMPFLAANINVRETGDPAYQQYVVFEKHTKDGHAVKVGVIGVVTPGVPGWDGAKVDSLVFRDTVETLKEVVPTVKGAGADVVIVLAHTGEDPTDYNWKPEDLQENAARSIAENVPGIDVLVAGHSHATNLPQKYYTNPDGREVLVTQPGYHARFLSSVSIPLSMKDGKVVVDWTDAEKPAATQLDAYKYEQDPQMEQVIAPWHEQTKTWVETVVAQSTEEMPAVTSRWEDTPILDFINKVQIDEVSRALEDTEYAGLPVLAEVSPFSRTAVFNKGDVTIADMAALYIYDNTLLGIKVNGAQLKDYLEWSARYYIQQQPGAEIADWESVVGAQYEGMTRPLPDYTYDVLSGVNYHIDISKPVGERIDLLTMADGTPIADTDEFVLALNNYRQSGGSSYPHVKDAPIVYDEQKAIRDLMIEWAQAKGEINPADFFEQNWSVSTSPAEGADEPSEPGENMVVTPLEPKFVNPSSSDPASCTVKPYATVEPVEGVVYTVKVGDKVLTANADGKFVYDYGQTVSVTAAPAEGYEFADGTTAEWAWTATLADNCKTTQPTKAEDGKLAKTGSSDIFAISAAALALLLAGTVMVRRRVNA